MEDTKVYRITSVHDSPVEKRKQRVPTNMPLDNIELPSDPSKLDYWVTIGGHLTSKPLISPYDKEGKYNKAKFRLLVFRNVYPVPCVCKFQKADQIDGLERGTNLIVCGMMRHTSSERVTKEILEVSNLIIMPDGYYGLDLRSLLIRLSTLEDIVNVLVGDVKEIKDQMDSYGIKITKKRDWREGAEPGSLW